MIFEGISRPKAGNKRVGELENYFLGLIHLPPNTRDNTTKAIAIHEKAVWSVEIPMTRKANPRTRKTEDELLQFMCGIILSVLEILS